MVGAGRPPLRDVLPAGVASDAAVDRADQGPAPVSVPAAPVLETHAHLTAEGTEILHVRQDEPSPLADRAFRRSAGRNVLQRRVVVKDGSASAVGTPRPSRHVVQHDQRAASLAVRGLHIFRREGGESPALHDGAVHVPARASRHQHHSHARSCSALERLIPMQRDADR